MMFCVLAANFGSARAEETTTALVVTPFHDGRVVPGDDGKDHVVYELLAVNVFSSSITVQSVTILGPDGNGLLTLEGDALAAATQSTFDQRPLASIPASGAATIEIDLGVAPGTAPPSVSHRIAYGFGEDPLAPMIGSRQVAGPEVAIDTRQPITILPPLTGPRWGAFNGCCSPNLHRSLRVGANTRIATPETFAIDWIQVDEQGRFYEGDGKRVEDYPSFGAPVRSVAAGEVVAMHDGMAESVPFERTALSNPVEFGGNYVLVRIQPDIYAVYGHLQQGTVAVGVGDRVETGQLLGRLGNSGNSSNPHLHFGLLDRADYLTGNSVPFVFENYRLRARITGGGMTGLTIEADDREVNDAHPLVYGIADYE